MPYPEGLGQQVQRVIAKVDKQGYLLDEYGRRIAKLEDKNLDSFITEVRMTLAALREGMAMLQTTVATSNVELRNEFDKLESTVSDLQTGQTVSSTTADTKNQAMKDFVSLRLVPFIALASVVVALLALVLK